MHASPLPMRAAQVRVRAGRASPIEEQRADVVRLNAEAAVERAERSLALARGNLARYIGQPVNVALDVVWFDRVGGYGPSSDLDPRDTLAMTVAKADLSTTEAQIRLARSQRVPDITLSASARRLGHVILSEPSRPGVPQIMPAEILDPAALKAARQALLFAHRSGLPR